MTTPAPLCQYDQNCTLIIHRSHHHYIQPETSVAASIVAAAAGVPLATDSSTSQLAQQANISDLQKRLESNRDGVKLQALREVILWVMQPGTSDMTSGTTSNTGAHVASRLLMTVIRYVLPSADHQITKVLQLYWEMVDKTKPDGTLKDEMILVCNKLREDLLHANEYIRGSTLRLLCKIKFIKILEPLVEAIVQNLAHHCAYVRRNAIMCIYSMVRSFGTDILPHAAEEIEKLLLVETDLSTKRNAFLMLIHCDCQRAVSYALSVQDDVGCLGDIFQLALLELLRKVAKETPSHVGNLLRMIISFVDSCSPAVAYGGGGALVGLSSSPVALKAAARAYVSLLTWQADNTVKLVVLDRLEEIYEKHPSALEEFVVDILRALSCPSLAVRKKALALALKLVSQRTVQDVVASLKKELMSTAATDNQQDSDSFSQHSTYQQLLIRSIRSACRGRFHIAIPILPLLLDFLSHRKPATAAEVVMFIRELVAQCEESRSSLLPKLIETIGDVGNCRVARVCLWLLGEYTETQELRELALDTIYELLLPMPFPSEVTDKPSGESSVDDAPASTSTPATERKVRVITRTIVLPDGTYGTEDVYEQEDEPATKEAAAKPMSKLRGLLVSGDSLLASLLAMTITKLVVNKFESVDEAQTLPAQQRAKAIFIVGSLLKLCYVPERNGGLGDAALRINQALRILLGATVKPVKGSPSKEWFPESRTALREVLEMEKEAALYEAEGEAGTESTADTLTEELKGCEPDEMIVFTQLGGEEVAGVPGGREQEDPAENLNLALGTGAQKEDISLFQQRLARVQQMTGLADPVYVEAFVQVNQLDLIVELLVVNRTTETLQNVNVELSTHGDLKVVERPAPITLAAGQAYTMHASIRVQSTETGIIFGHITFDYSSGVEKEYLVLNELHVDLLDFIQRSWVSEFSFRSMWAEFEWENKITINATNINVTNFLERVMQQTSMTIVGKYMSKAEDGKSQFANLRTLETPWSSSVDLRPGDTYLARVKQLPGLRRLLDNSAFFAINLYSRSIFGEDALANISVEKLADGRLAGTVRIRSRSQGIALSLGDRITVVQRSLLS